MSLLNLVLKIICRWIEQPLNSMQGKHVGPWVLPPAAEIDIEASCKVNANFGCINGNTVPEGVPILSFPFLSCDSGPPSVLPCEDSSPAQVMSLTSSHCLKILYLPLSLLSPASAIVFFSTFLLINVAIP